MRTTSLIIIAGSETTATLLSGATYYLLRNPDALAKLNREVRSAFSSDDEITFTAVSQLPYLHAVLEESFRVYPPVAAELPRKTRPEGDIINGRFVPGNVSTVAIPPALLIIKVHNANPTYDHRQASTCTHGLLTPLRRTSPPLSYSHRSDGSRTHPLNSRPTTARLSNHFR